MLRVKISCRPAVQNLLRREANHAQYLNPSIKFVFDDDDPAPFDWWVVCHNTGLIETTTLNCDPKNIVYVAMEPTEAVTGTQIEFVNQFPIVVSTDENLQVRGRQIRRMGFNWWVGYEIVHDGHSHRFGAPTLSASELARLQPVEPKLNRVSFINSKKQTYPGHLFRAKFVRELLDTSAGKYIDVFGGDNPIKDKLSAILPYRFHLAIENDQIKGYWTEKLGDAFLGLAHPVYLGAPDIYEYFCPAALTSLNGMSAQAAAVTILKLVENARSTEYEAQLEEARKRVLNDYSLFGLISSLVVRPAEKYSKVTLSPNLYFKNRLRYFVSRATRSLRNA